MRGGGRFLNLKNQAKLLAQNSLVFKSCYDLFKYIFDEIYHFSNAKDEDAQILHLCNIAIILLANDVIKQDSFKYNKLEINPQEYLMYLVEIIPEFNIKIYQDNFFLCVLNLIYTLGYKPEECIKARIENFEDMKLSFKAHLIKD